MVTASWGITAGHKYFCYRSQPNISQVVMLTVSWGITAGHPEYFGFSLTLENDGRKTPGKVALWTQDAGKYGLETPDAMINTDARRLENFFMDAGRLQKYPPGRQTPNLSPPS